MLIPYFQPVNASSPKQIIDEIALCRMTSMDLRVWQEAHTNSNLPSIQEVRDTLYMLGDVMDSLDTSVNIKRIAKAYGNQNLVSILNSSRVHTSNMYILQDNSHVQYLPTQLVDHNHYVRSSPSFSSQLGRGPLAPRLGFAPCDDVPAPIEMWDTWSLLPAPWPLPSSPHVPTVPHLMDMFTLCIEKH